MHIQQLFPSAFKQMYPGIYIHAVLCMGDRLCCVANTFLDKTGLFSVIAQDLGAVEIN